MAELEDDMDQLFKQAAENYRLKDPSDDWDGIAGRLTGELPVSVPVMETPGKPWALLLLLLFMLSVCGYLAHVIITNYKQQALYTTTANHNQSPSTIRNAPGAHPIPNIEKTVTNTSILTVPAPAQSHQQVSNMPVSDSVQRSSTRVDKRNTASVAQRNSSNFRKQNKVQVAVSAPSVISAKSSIKKAGEEEIVQSLTKDTHQRTNHLNDDSAIAKGEIKKQLQAPVATTNDAVLPGLTPTDTLKQAAKADTLKEEKGTVPKKKVVTQRPQKGLLLGIAAGPEWNQVQRQRYTRTGYDIGIIAGYQYR